MQREPGVPLPPLPPGGKEAAGGGGRLADEAERGSLLASVAAWGLETRGGIPEGGGRGQLPDAIGGDVQRVPLGVVVDIDRQSHVRVVGRVEIGDGSAGDSQAPEDCGQKVGGTMETVPTAGTPLGQPLQWPNWAAGPPCQGAEPGQRMGSLLQPLGFLAQTSWPELEGLKACGWAGKG